MTMPACPPARPETRPAPPRFVLVSESDIPLYDPLTLHQQLMAETKSRVNLCRNSISDVRRWSWRMAVSGRWPLGSNFAAA